MEYMFYGCTNLTSINFGNFDTSKTTNMKFMFNSCISLKYLDLSNFNTSKVKNMYFMFNNCTSLIYIKLNFNTSSTYNMSSMFAYCDSLKCLNLSSFDTSKVERMERMFLNCLSLTNIDISNFHTQKVIDMFSMFAICKSLISLNLSGFDTRNVESIYSMFEDCSSLTHLDISNFNLPKVDSLRNMFCDCSSLTSLNLSNFNPPNNVRTVENLFFNCSSLYVLDFSRLKLFSNNLNIYNMFFGCSKLKYVNLDSTSFYITKKNMIISNLYSLNDDIIICGSSNFFSNENSLDEIDTYCINKLYGFNGSNDDYHCFSKYKEDSNNTNFTCPYYYPDNKNTIINTIETINNSDGISHEKGDNIIEFKRKELLKSFNKSYIDQGNDLEIYESNIQFALTSTYNQKQIEKISMNKTAINLGECETKLKVGYNISSNDSLYIFKIDKKIEGMKIPKIE